MVYALDACGIWTLVILARLEDALRKHSRLRGVFSARSRKGRIADDFCNSDVAGCECDLNAGEVPHVRCSMTTIAVLTEGFRSWADVWHPRLRPSDTRTIPTVT